MAYSTSTLAAGAFGKVYRQKYNDSWAAVKKVPQHLIKRTDLERECEVYKKASHPNIVKLLGNITLKDSLWIIPLEFIFGEDMEMTIFDTQKSKIQLTPPVKATIITGMCEGLMHLHGKDIVHQDLKPDNIMVEHGTNRAVIIDLGLAKFYRNGLNSATDMGNEAYSAPEVLQRQGQRDQRSDVWAMGKIIAELCARVRLHTPSVCPAKVQEILRGQPYCSAVCRMVESNPSLRASMAGVILDIKKAGGGGGGNMEGLPRGRQQTPFTHTEVKKRSPSPSRWERRPTPMQEVRAALRPQNAVVSRSPSPRAGVDKGKALVPLATAQPSQDVMRKLLHQEASQAFPCPLPTTGKVRIRRYEERNGEVETWEQKEVETKGGRIVKFEDVTFNNKQ